MTKNTDFITNFINSQKDLMKYFGCDGDFYIRPLINNNWSIKNQDNFSILSYWESDNRKIDAVIVRKSGKPMIYKKSDFTMIIGIDCVKLAFVFKTQLEK